MTAPPSAFKEKGGRFSGLAASHRLVPAFLILLLAGITFLAYSNSLDGGFVYDDVQVYSNPNIRLQTLTPEAIIRATHGWQVKNRPIAYLTFALNYYFGGMETFGYHLVNILIHIASGLVIFLIFRVTLRLVRQGREDHGLLLPWFAALLWLVHPLNSQAVSYIVQRMASLAAFFYLAAFLAWLIGRTAEKKRAWFFLSALVLWGLALGSKENAVTLPLAILAYEWIFFREGRVAWFKTVVPWIAAGMLVILAMGFILTDFHPWAKVVGGFDSRPFTMWQRLITESRVLVFYLSLFVWPHPSRLNLEHHFTVSTSLLHPPTTLLAVFFLALLAGGAIFGRRRYPLVAFAVLWFFIVHLIESTIFPLDLVYEHRNYLALVFPCLALSRFAAERIRPFALKCAVALAVVLIFSVFVHQRNLVWHDRISLWQDCVAKSPRRLRPRYDLAWNLQLRGRLDEAVYHYLVAIDIDPSYIRSYNNLGLLLLDKGFPDDAILVLKDGIRRAPDYGLIHVSLGRAYMMQGDLPAAGKEFSHALRLDPENKSARANMRAWRRAVAASAAGGAESVDKSFDNLLY